MTPMAKPWTFVAAAVPLFAGAAQAQYAPDLEAGGLRPPPPPESHTYEELETQRSLERAEREDSGRGLEFFWLNGEAGVMLLGLQTFSADDLLPEVEKTSQTGPAFGAGLGLRLLFLTLGGRFRLGMFDQYQVWTLNGELGFHVPIGRLEPYFTFGGGYASVGSLEGDLTGGFGSDVDIDGYNVRGGFGIDYYLSSVFSLGVNLTGEILVLTRPGLDPSQLGTTPTTADEAYQRDGSSVGSAATLTAVAGLHF